MKSSKPVIRVIDALYKARAVFKRHRWIQNNGFRETPTAGYCLLGAIDKSHGVSESDLNFAQDKVRGAAVIARAVKELFPERYVARGQFSGNLLSNEERVLRFNDDEYTTRKDALKVLDRAIELAEDQTNRQ